MSAYAKSARLYSTPHWSNRRASKSQTSIASKLSARNRESNNLGIGSQNFEIGSETQLNIPPPFQRRRDVPLPSNSPKARPCEHEANRHTFTSSSGRPTSHHRGHNDFSDQNDRGDIREHAIHPTLGIPRNFSTIRSDPSCDEGFDPNGNHSNQHMSQLTMNDFGSSPTYISCSQSTSSRPQPPYQQNRNDFHSNAPQQQRGQLHEQDRSKFRSSSKVVSEKNPFQEYDGNSLDDDCSTVLMSQPLVSSKVSAASDLPRNQQGRTPLRSSQKHLRPLLRDNQTTPNISRRLDQANSGSVRSLAQRKSRPWMQVCKDVVEPLRSSLFPQRRSKAPDSIARRNLHNGSRSVSSGILVDSEEISTKEEKAKNYSGRTMDRNPSYKCDESNNSSNKKHDKKGKSDTRCAETENTEITVMDSNEKASDECTIKTASFQFQADHSKHRETTPDQVPNVSRSTEQVISIPDSSVNTEASIRDSDLKEQQDLLDNRATALADQLDQIQHNIANMDVKIAEIDQSISKTLTQIRATGEEEKTKLCKVISTFREKHESNEQAQADKIKILSDELHSVVHKSANRLPEEVRKSVMPSIEANIKDVIDAAVAEVRKDLIDSMKQEVAAQTQKSIMKEEEASQERIIDPPETDIAWRASLGDDNDTVVDLHITNGTKKRKESSLENEYAPMRNSKLEASSMENQTSTPKGQSPVRSAIVTATANVRADLFPSFVTNAISPKRQRDTRSRGRTALDSRSKTPVLPTLPTTAPRHSLLPSFIRRSLSRCPDLHVLKRAKRPKNGVRSDDTAQDTLIQVSHGLSDSSTKHRERRHSSRIKQAREKMDTSGKNHSDFPVRVVSPLLSSDGLLRSGNEDTSNTSRCVTPKKGHATSISGRKRYGVRDLVKDKVERKIDLSGVKSSEMKKNAAPRQSSKPNIGGRKTASARKRSVTTAFSLPKDLGIASGLVERNELLNESMYTAGRDKESDSLYSNARSEQKRPSSGDSRKSSVPTNLKRMRKKTYGGKRRRLDDLLKDDNFAFM
mmetsp:Transcript_19802/g.35950  ORF Transcript_19802/g.35950 Transcript_19802/m.35950 type:complete len:1027 (-) Transcript_19802:168-3248(-)